MKHQDKSIYAFLLSAALALPGAAGAADRPPPPAARPPCMQQTQQGPGADQHGPRRGPGMGFPGHGAGGPPYLRDVELSEAQQDKVFAITHAQAPLLREQYKAAASAHEALQALARADRFDEGKATVLAQSAAQAMARIAVLHARAEQQIRALLTPEQRKQLEAGTADGPRHPPRPQ